MQLPFEARRLLRLKSNVDDRIAHAIALLKQHTFKNNANSGK